MADSGDLYKNLTEAGNEIMDSVNQAIASGDFSHLNQDIGSTVQKTVYQIGSDGKARAGKIQASFTWTSGDRDRKVRSVYDIPEITAGIFNKLSGKTPYFQKTLSKVREVSLKGIGACGLIFWLLAALGTAFFSVPAAVVSGALAGVNGWLLYLGIRLGKLNKQYYRYGEIIGDKQYADINELSEVCGESKEETLKNLQEMIKKDYFRYARITEDDRTLCLTQEAYDQCESAIRQRRQILSEAEKSGQNSKEVEQILSEGTRYLESIREANDQIEDEVMSQKLDRLASIVQRIFEAVKKEPSSASELRRFLTYYLPTTDKLLKAYVELVHQPSGPNVENTKKQIEDSMDTIISAYEKLLDSLFEDMSWDVASDISVMNTMLKQDGLAGENIRSQNKV
ncbi:MAG: 5-bromo-4-chloroindolyl phosphate hydrolysis family protein [Lachnospiraceae bacterium]